MPSIVKPLNLEISVTSANTVYNATLVRIRANGGAATITVANTSANIASFSMVNNTVEYLEKDKNDTITASVGVDCTPVAYRA